MTKRHEAVLASVRYYNQAAAEYVDQDRFWDNPYDREIWRLEHDLIRQHLDPASPLLDLGCGFYPHFEFTSNRDVVAIDVSQRSLQVARTYGDESEKVVLVQADAMSLPFAESAFGQVIAGGELLNHLDYELCLNEVRRVLKPGGVVLIEFGAKWCFDSLWALLDSFTGHHLGYTLTRPEAKAFWSRRSSDVEVTWEVTPGYNLRVSLIAVENLLRVLGRLGFSTLDMYGANSISGLVPLPLQQSPDGSSIAKKLASVLILVDRVVGRVPPFKTFAGNVFVVCRRN